MDKLVKMKGRGLNVAPQEIDIVIGDSAPGGLAQDLEFPKPKLIERRVANLIRYHHSRGLKEFLRIASIQAWNGQASNRPRLAAIRVGIPQYPVLHLRQRRSQASDQCWVELRCHGMGADIRGVSEVVQIQVPRLRAIPHWRSRLALAGCVLTGREINGYSVAGIKYEKSC